jgi:hypothetical protein
MLALIDKRRDKLLKIHLKYCDKMRNVMVQLIVLNDYKIIIDNNCCEITNICECCNYVIGCRDALYIITTYYLDEDFDVDEWDDFYENKMPICENCNDIIEDMILPYKNREITRRLLVAELPIIADICALINARIFALLKD